MMLNGEQRNMLLYYYDEQESADFAITADLTVEELDEFENEIQSDTGKQVQCWLVAKSKFAPKLKAKDLHNLAVLTDGSVGYFVGGNFIPTDIQAVRSAVRDEVPMNSAKKTYLVSFNHGDDIYCTNLAEADSEEAVKEYYKEYSDVSVKPAENWEIESYGRRGMPLVKCNSSDGDSSQPESREELIDALDAVYRDREDDFLGALYAITKTTPEAFEELEDSDPTEGFFKHFDTSTLAAIWRKLNTPEEPTATLTLDITKREYNALKAVLGRAYTATSSEFEQDIIDKLTRQLYRTHINFEQKGR